ncbi:transcriptional attenuator, LytR family [Klenkia marina]|uniref:Transcriptional attenuator, LytR family n=1 Tax=Klenkia marina TaxID=1960309 RepID=A0A1G4XPU9_9ACTN|nr:LCP family protein [Klenkia marina]SCX43241.1 transcriptional attenuator, LytR family [Klenkia marina]
MTDRPDPREPDDRTTRIPRADAAPVLPPVPGGPGSAAEPRRRRRAEGGTDPELAARARAAAGLPPVAPTPSTQTRRPSAEQDATTRLAPVPAASREEDAARGEQVAGRREEASARREDAGPVASGPGRARSFRRAAGLTVLGAVVPGAGLLAAGWRRTGVAVLAVFVVLLGGLVWLATAGQRTAVRAAVSPQVLLGVMVGVGVLALLWIAVVVLGYRLLVPRRLSPLQRGAGGLLVLALVAGVATPAVAAVRLADAQRDLVDTVFADGESATVQEPADPVNPFGDKERVNVLLLGGDGGEGRDGVRTDTVIVASIETATGATTLFSLPRNLEDLPFPAGTRLAELFPDGFDAGEESESLLNAVYRNGPALYPDALGAPSDNPGADWLKLGVGEALGLPIDYYVLVNLDGFSQLVDALGGITVNVNYYVPVGGEPSIGTLPDAYIAPGPDQEMDGATALAFARGRFGLTDYQRMDRQRCVLDAIVAAADPVTLLTRYQQLAATTSDIVSTDVPQAVLDDFVDLAFLVKDAGIRSVVFDDTVITPAYPDYDAVRALVQQALGAAPASAPASGAPSSSAAPTTAAPTTTAPTSGAPASSSAPVADVADACAYDPVAAQAAIDAGEPPTKR